MARLSLAALATCFGLNTLSARADNVGPGSDMFITVPTASYLQFSAAATPPRVIPGGFFGPGSDPFEGTIYWLGAPLSGTNLNGADTIVERTGGTGPLDCGGADVVAIRIKALGLTSNGPITVTFDSGVTSSTYDVRACLSSVEPQPLGSMTIRQECPEGGTFDATLPVIPRLTFTKVSGASGLPSVILDCGDPANAAACDEDFGLPGIQPQVFTTASGFWSHTDPGYGVIGSVGGTVDHDCNGGTAPLPFLPTSPNFFAGIGWDACNACAPGIPPREPMKTLTEEQARLAAHGISDIQPQSNCCFTTDVDGDRDLDCVNAPTREHCLAEGGVMFFPTDVCVPAPGHAPKFGDYCVPKDQQQHKLIDCPANPPPSGPWDCCGACLPGANWVDTCAPGDDSLDPTWAEVGLDTNLDGVVDQSLLMSGPMTVRRGAPAAGIIQTEIISMSLTGGGVTLRAGTQTIGINPAVQPTTGRVTEQVTNNTLADSFFDVFFEIDLGGGQKLYNQTALRVAGVIQCVPPSAAFRKVGNQPVSLFAAPSGGSEVARVVDVKHFTDPNPPGTGACCLPNNGCVLNVASDACVKLGGRYLGDGTTECFHDPAGDCIPTVSEWGLLVMAVLVLTAATVVIMRRRAAVA